MYDVCLDLWCMYAKLINVCMSQISDNAKWHDNAKIYEINKLKLYTCYHECMNEDLCLYVQC